MNTIFTQIILSSGQKVDILECNGGHLYDAYIIGGMELAKNPTILAMVVASIITKINGKSIGMQALKELPIFDVTIIMEVINAQFMNVKNG